MLYGALTCLKNEHICYHKLATVVCPSWSVGLLWQIGAMVIHHDGHTLLQCYHFFSALEYISQLGVLYTTTYITRIFFPVKQNQEGHSSREDKWKNAWQLLINAILAELEFHAVNSGPTNALLNRTLGQSNRSCVWRAKSRRESYRISVTWT